MKDILSNPVVSLAVIGAIVAFMNYLQFVFQEKRRKAETESSRDKQAEANANKVVEKLNATGKVISNPPVEPPPNSGVE